MALLLLWPLRAIAQQLARETVLPLPQSETQEFPKLDHIGIDKKAPREVAEAVGAYFRK